MSELAEDPGRNGERGDGGGADLEELQDLLGYRFKDPSLLQLALTHESYANEVGLERCNNERLEFLGDAVLGYEVCRYLYRAHPDLPEGKLAQIKAHVVSTDFLAGLARALDLGRFLRLGRGEELSQGRHRRNILADTLEAVIGAICLDGNVMKVRPIIRRLWKDALDQREGLDKDFKSQLQEHTQRIHRSLPRYLVIGEEGPAHQKTFRMQVEFMGVVLGEGTGRSKQRASQKAAQEALESLRSQEGSGEGTPDPGEDHGGMKEGVQESDPEDPTP